MGRFFAIVFLLAGAWASYAAIQWMLWQHRAMTLFVPVPARILDAHVEVQHGSKSTSYTPEITYSYQYQGKPYQSTRVFPASMDSDESSANDIVNRFKGLMDVTGIEANAPQATAYVDPQHPEEAILLREYSFGPYFVSIMALLATSVALGGATGMIASERKTMAAIPLDASDRRLLLPLKSLRGSARNSMIVFITLALVVVPVSAHWIFVAKQWNQGIGPWFVLTIFGAILIGCALLTIRCWSVSRHISDARLTVRPAPMIRGRPFGIEVEADAFAPLRITEARCTLKCIESYREKSGNKTRVGIRIHHEQSIILSGPAQITAGQVFSGKGSVTCDPEFLPPTTDRARRVYPSYAWQIIVSIALEGAVDYEGIFPIDVV